MNIHRESLWTGSKRRRQLTLLLGDSIVLLGTAAIAVFLRKAVFEEVPWRSATPWPLPSGAYALWFSYLVALYVFDQYNLKRDIRTRAAAIVLALACFAGLMLTTTITFFLRDLQLGRFVTVIQLPMAIIGLYLWRLIFFSRLLRFARPHRVLLVVANPVERGIELEVRDRPLGDYTVAGVFMAVGTSGNSGYQLLDEKGRTLEQVVTSEAVDTLVFSARSGFPPEYLEKAIDWKFDGINVFDAANFYGAMTGRVPIETIDARWVLDHLSQPYGSAVVWRLKRVVDIVLGLLLLLISLPFWPFLMIAIRLDSPGPAIFRQERLGLRQKPIVIAKFRSMFVTFEEEGEAAYAQKEDPRVTRVGRFLRKTRLDELPQLWNVVRGELSIVGLRPIRKINADRLGTQIPFYHLRFSMKPGMTGWPQIQYHYADDDESHVRKFEYELYHIQNASIAFDLYLILKTVQQFFFGRGQ